MQSPRTQALMAPPTDAPKSTDEFFAESFEQLAIQRFTNEHPDIASMMIAFKVLDADSSTGMARGTFILDHSGKEVHVPIILQDNNVQPIDTLYDKDTDRYMPLRGEFLDTIGAQEVDSLGYPDTPSQTASSNLDTRNLVVPPATGKLVYAAEAAVPKSITALAMAPYAVKEAFVEILRSNSKIAEYALNTFGHEMYAAALSSTPYKVASHRGVTKHAAYDPELVRVVTYDTPASVTKSIFGLSGEALPQINEYGYAIKDERPANAVNRAIRVESRLRLTQPSENGYYRIFLADGTVRCAFIVVNVKRLDPAYAAKSLAEGGPTRATDPMRAEDGCGPGPYAAVGVTTDGMLFTTEIPFIAERITDNEVSSKVQPFIERQTITMPRNGQYGFFMGYERASLAATPLVKVRSVNINGSLRNMTIEQVYTTRPDEIHAMHFIQNVKSPSGTVQVLQGAEAGSHKHPPSINHGEVRWDGVHSHGRSVVLIPGSFTFVSGTQLLNDDLLLRDPRAVYALFEQEIALSGGRPLSVISTGGTEIAVNGDPMPKMAAVAKLIRVYGLGSEDTRAIIKEAEDKGRSDCSVLSPAGLRRYALRVKVANSPAAGQMAQAGIPGVPPTAPPPMGGEAMVDTATGMPMDPMMAGMPMDPMMAGMVPPGPSPTEIAANEVSQQLMSQYEQLMSEMEKQRQISEAQITALQMVVDRANQISMEMGGPPPELLPPADVLGIGTPEPAPEQEMVPAVDQAPPPDQAAMLPADSIAPQAMEAGANLADPELFDAASLAALTDLDTFDQAVDQYAPQLEQSLDTVGRVLLNVRSSAPELQERMGYSEYKELENALKTIFDATGKAVSKIRRVPAAAGMSSSFV